MNTRSRPYPATRQDFFREQLFKTLENIDGGLLTISQSGERFEFGDATSDLHAHIVVHDPQFYRRVGLGGSVAAGESYFEEQWDSENLTAVVRLLVRNRDLLDRVDSGMARAAAWALRLWHKRNDNSRSGSAKNIHAHYDTGNALFERILDSHMMYSCADYASGAETLEQASEAKMHRICQALQLKREDHLLEIGTGWGGFACFAAQHYGCKVTTTTISREQHRYAESRIKQAGLSDQITLLLKDYRDLGGQFDKLVSIEMVEAVGANYLDGYFRVIRDRLKPSGKALIQAITIEDNRYQHALKNVDFIKRHVFPGSFIPCVSVLTQSAAKAALVLQNLDDIGPSYATTLRAWDDRMHQHWSELQQQGFDKRFKRLWHFYFCYCEGGFLEKALSDVQMLFTNHQGRH